MLGKWENDALQDSAGNAVVVSGATVEVRFQSTGNLVGSSELFIDADGLIPLGNPFVVSGSTIAFYAFSSDRYKIKITKGAFERTLENEAVSTPPVSDFMVTVLDDPDENAAQATLGLLADDLYLSQFFGSL